MNNRVSFYFLILDWMYHEKTKLNDFRKLTDKKDKNEGESMSRQSIKEIEAQLFSQEAKVDEALLEQWRIDTRKGVSKLIEKYDRQKQREEEERLLFFDKLKYENELRRSGVQYIAGIDEVGRGPLAGPVVASAVILSDDFFLPGLTDSKKLSKLQRERFYDEIMNKAKAVSVYFLRAAEIDRLNIYQATKLAMLRAVESLSVNPEHLLIDAMELPLEIRQTSLIKGDLKSASIAAASIIAKVERDRYMEKLGVAYPQYGFERHMGYPTKEHLEAIYQYGIIEEHRCSFAPIKEWQAKC